MTCAFYSIVYDIVFLIERKINYFILFIYFIFFHRQQYGRAGCLPFRSQQYGRRTCRAYPFQLPAVWMCRVYLFPQPVEWTCWVYPGFMHLFFNAGQFGNRSFRYPKEKKFRRKNRSRAGIKGPSPVPQCSGTRLRDQMPECRCQRH